ncbi:hypothetical protein ACFQZF_15160 [Flavobacterium myungsuense]|uniref:hypothetical protein n=1 Tax=Flavobacterium myungsuense TaxID=651823 RepID=UPI003626DD1D
MNDSHINTIFFKIKYILVALLLSFVCKAQVVIVSDGLNNSSSLFNLVGGTYYSGNSATGDSPASSPFFRKGQTLEEYQIIQRL